jgi:hypothetical protein
MSIVNGLGIAGYSRTLARGFEGQHAETEGVLSRAYRNPRLAQITNIAIGGFGADADSVVVRITMPTGVVRTFTVTRAAGVPVDDAAAAVALAALVNADTLLRGHVVATTSTVNLILSFTHPNIVYPVATSVVAATAAVTTTQAAGGTSIAFGRVITAGASVDGQPAVREPQNADTEDLFVGVTIRHLDVANLESPLASSVDADPPGNMVTVGQRGTILMRNNGSVASAVNGLVFVVVNTAGAQERGMVRADDDAANSVPLALARARWVEVTQPGELGAVYFEF